VAGFKAILTIYKKMTDVVFVGKLIMIHCISAAFVAQCGAYTGSIHGVGHDVVDETEIARLL
jgi:hypothetical protein